MFANEIKLTQLKSKSVFVKSKKVVLTKLEVSKNFLPLEFVIF